VFRTNLKQELEIEKSALKLNIQKGHPACSTSSGAKRLGTCSDISFGAECYSYGSNSKDLGYFMMSSYPKIVLDHRGMPSNGGHGFFSMVPDGFPIGGEPHQCSGYC